MNETSEPDFALRSFLGFTIERGEGLASTRLEVAPEHFNPNGVVHGAVLFAMMDTAMGAAVMSVIEDGQHCATIEIHTRYHRPVSSGSLRGEAVVMTAGKRIVHLEARTRDDDDRIVASATGSFAVITSPMD